jgi:hypothetical protein
MVSKSLKQAANLLDKCVFYHQIYIYLNILKDEVRPSSEVSLRIGTIFGASGCCMGQYNEW